MVGSFGCAGGWSCGHAPRAAGAGFEPGGDGEADLGGAQPGIDPSLSKQGCDLAMVERATGDELAQGGRSQVEGAVALADGRGGQAFQFAGDRGAEEGAAPVAGQGQAD